MRQIISKGREDAVKRPVPAVWPTRDDGKIAIVGEAPGADEVLNGHPFAGSGGELLNECLRRADIKREDCLLTNVFEYKPAGDDLGRFFVKRTQVKQFEGWKPRWPLSKLGYVEPEREDALDRLREEITRFDPHVIIALGGVALWALTGEEGISKFRGHTIYTNDWFHPSKQWKVVPALHPDAVVRGWSGRPVFIADLIKAQAESNTRTIKRIEREVWIEPQLADIEKFYNEMVEPMQGSTTPLSFDIETDMVSQITCIGFSPNDNVSFVIPFCDKNMDSGSYWSSAESEAVAWGWVKKILEDPTIPKLAQNCTYDITWLARIMGIYVRGNVEDTMHMHHALQPEMRKDLGMLASLYTNERPWKTMVKFHKSNKRDE